jgi:hypothetical protein
MRLIITQGGDIIADIPDYRGQVPAEGQYIRRPRLGTQEPTPPPPDYADSLMRVSGVLWGIIARPQGDGKHFVGAADPFVEVVV